VGRGRRRRLGREREMTRGYKWRVDENGCGGCRQFGWRSAALLCPSVAMMVQPEPPQRSSARRSITRLHAALDALLLRGTSYFVDVEDVSVGATTSSPGLHPFGPPPHKGEVGSARLPPL
jgi:hypothetical protein